MIGIHTDYQDSLAVYAHKSNNQAALELCKRDEAELDSWKEVAFLATAAATLILGSSLLSFGISLGNVGEILSLLGAVTAGIGVFAACKAIKAQKNIDENNETPLETHSRWTSFLQAEVQRLGHKAESLNAKNKQLAAYATALQEAQNKDFTQQPGIQDADL